MARCRRPLASGRGSRCVAHDPRALVWQVLYGLHTFWLAVALSPTLCYAVWTSVPWLFGDHLDAVQLGSLIAHSYRETLQLTWPVWFTPTALLEFVLQPAARPLRLLPQPGVSHVGAARVGNTLRRRADGVANARAHVRRQQVA